MRCNQLFALAAFAILAFAATFLLVARGLTASVDVWLMQAILEASDTSAKGVATWQSEALRDLTALGSGTVITIAVLIIALLALAGGRYRMAVVLPGGVLAAAAVNLGLKGMVSRSRPDFLTVVPPTFTDSFPSGHAFLTLTVTLATALLLPTSLSIVLRRSAIILALVLSFFVGLSRTVLGVHWPSDVFAGWCLGLAFAALIAAVAGAEGSSEPHETGGREHQTALPR